MAREQVTGFTGVTHTRVKWHSWRTNYVTSSSDKMYSFSQSPPPCEPLLQIFFRHSVNFLNVRKIKGIMFENKMKFITLDITIFGLTRFFQWLVNGGMLCILWG